MEKLIIEIKQKLEIIEVYKSHDFRVFYEGNKSALKRHMISNITKVIDIFFSESKILLKSKALSSLKSVKIIFISLVKHREFIILILVALSKVAYPGQLWCHQFWRTRL